MKEDIKNIYNNLIFKLMHDLKVNNISETWIMINFFSQNSSLPTLFPLKLGNDLNLPKNCCKLSSLPLKYA